ncbi:MAG: alpha-ketoacid dehydrogenase subunit beta [Deltaproteobacteria bacterium]|nr:alpha-ketoacid dehydrogenase subunit beta [Deltaproteobacteria bacterium]
MPWTHIYADKEDWEGLAPEKGLRSLSYVQALNETQELLLESDPAVFVLGEGVDDPGGVFGSTLGLAGKFGKKRVLDLPIAENGMTGVALGAALAGMRPIFVHMRTDFLLMCADQIANHAAKWRYMSGGNQGAPLVIRAIIGRGWGSAAQHSQALQSMFLPVPGLRIFTPATPYDAKGLLVWAVKSKDPVLFIEHRWLYGSVGYVPEGLYTVEPGQAVVRRQGTDATVVAVSHMNIEAARAARALSARGISIEIVDPRTIAPLDMETILKSVEKTGRLVICDCACRTGGAASEIAARVAEAGPSLLRAPVARVTFPDIPTPASPVLEEAYYPGAKDIARAVAEIMP